MILLLFFETPEVRGINSEVVISTVIAISALVLTLWQMRETRRHNKLSVKPDLFVNRHSNHEDEKFNITLINNGQGPAILALVKFKIANTSIDFNQTGFKIKEEISRALESNGFHLHPECKFNITGISGRYSLPSGQQFHLIVMDWDNVTKSTKEFNEINNLFEESNIEVEYKSIYGENFNL